MNTFRLGSMVCGKRAGKSYRGELLGIGKVLARLRTAEGRMVLVDRDTLRRYRLELGGSTPKKSFPRDPRVLDKYDPELVRLGRIYDLHPSQVREALAE